ncbi:MAG: hypothetical protein A3B22_02530 [Candidatus Zambryskibacteria bacterium RIFCSPLOWO2_01_FULL_47_33]|nr:MAG: hypothetical protein A3B22_02530 [Candidatus Zambryskibacteria bacterium RIFCSPLOWO2_01_FULL_47_33]
MLPDAHAGTEMPAPAFSVHWETCEATEDWARAIFTDIKTPRETSSPPIKITAGMINFLDKNMFATG